MRIRGFGLRVAFLALSTGSAYADVVLPNGQTFKGVSAAPSHNVVGGEVVYTPWLTDGTTHVVIFTGSDLPDSGVIEFEPDVPRSLVPLGEAADCQGGPEVTRPSQSFGYSIAMPFAVPTVVRQEGQDPVPRKNATALIQYFTPQANPQPFVTYSVNIRCATGRPTNDR
jgi:hypothetical protein